MSFTVTGIREMQERLRELSRDMKDRAREEIKVIAEEIVERAKNEFVPVDEGSLRDSIKVLSADLSQGRDSGGRFTSAADVSISIGSDLPYSIAVHENPSSHDPISWQGKTINFSPSGRGPKFIEIPLREAEKDFACRVGEKIFGK